MKKLEIKNLEPRDGIEIGYGWQYVDIAEACEVGGRVLVVFNLGKSEDGSICLEKRVGYVVNVDMDGGDWVEDLRFSVENYFCEEEDEASDMASNFEDILKTSEIGDNVEDITPKSVRDLSTFAMVPFFYWPGKESRFLSVVIHQNVESGEIEALLLS